MTTATHWWHCTLVRYGRVGATHSSRDTCSTHRIAWRIAMRGGGGLKLLASQKHTIVFIHWKPVTVERRATLSLVQYWAAIFVLKSFLSLTGFEPNPSGPLRTSTRWTDCYWWLQWSSFYAASRVSNYQILNFNVVCHYTHCATSSPLIVQVYLHSNLRGGLRKRMYSETECVMAIQGRWF